MYIRFVDDRNIEIDDCRIMWRNFSGMEGNYPDPSNRGFAVVIPEQELADELIERGWNVTVRPPRNADDSPLYLLKVKFNYDRPGLEPSAYLQTGKNLRSLNEQTIGTLDKVDIKSVSLDVRKSEWNRGGRSGVTNYLQSVKIIQQVDRFAAEFENEDTMSENM